MLQNIYYGKFILIEKHVIFELSIATKPHHPLQHFCLRVIHPFPAHTLKKRARSYFSHICGDMWKNILYCLFIYLYIHLETIICCVCVCYSATNTLIKLEKNHINPLSRRRNGKNRHSPIIYLSFYIYTYVCMVMKLVCDFVSTPYISHSHTYTQTHTYSNKTFVRCICVCNCLFGTKAAIYLLNLLIMMALKLYFTCHNI